MKLSVRVSYIKAFKGEKFEQLIRYRDDNKFVDLDANVLTTTQLDKLVELAKATLAKDSKAEGARGLIQKITAYRNIRSAPEGKKIGKLETFEVALRAYIEPSPHKWVFNDQEDGHAVPYYVTNIRYHRTERDNPAYVSMHLSAVTRGKDDGTSVRFGRSDLGRSVNEILNAKGYYLETPDAVKDYLEDIDLYKSVSSKTGAQFRGSGGGFPMDHYSYRMKSLEKDGISATLVMDDDMDEDGRSRTQTSGTFTSNQYWAQKPKDVDNEIEDDEDEDEVSIDGEPDSVVTPVHPYVKVFDLGAHEFVLVHVRNLTPYVYDKAAEKKLVLPKETKELVNILVRGSSEVLEDIIQGKTGGTIVISTGPPGTGKTLTAEVFAEEIERPLYVVQCSQLGTDEEAIEKQLKIVLTRASRWKAILLIDEADVYVHTRGTDIRQNAIVGVFLRVLERYRGVLFLTSNRATVIDDAIMSRATAWIRYDYPTKEALQELWTVLSRQYQIEMSEKAIEALVGKFPKVSGRNIKNLLKLGSMLARGTSRAVNVDLFGYVAKFLDLSTDETSTTGSA
jgi:SpoVK/Ycf46/Vps4 family AAA+-type ATPase